MCFRIYLMCVQPDGMTFTIQGETVKDSDRYGHEQVQERIIAFVKAHGFKLEEFRITLVEGRYDVHAKLLNELLPIKDEWPKYQIALNINGDKRYSVSGFMSLAELKNRTGGLGPKDIVDVAVGYSRMYDNHATTRLTDKEHSGICELLEYWKLPNYNRVNWK